MKVKVRKVKKFSTAQKKFSTPVYDEEAGRWLDLASLMAVSRRQLLRSNFAK